MLFRSISTWSSLQSQHAAAPKRKSTTATTVISTPQAKVSWTDSIIFVPVIHRTRVENGTIRIVSLSVSITLLSAARMIQSLKYLPSIGRPCPNTALLWSRFRSEEHTSELQSLMRIPYAVFCLKTKTPYRASSTSATHPHHHDKPT